MPHFFEEMANDGLIFADIEMAVDRKGVFDIYLAANTSAEVATSTKIPQDVREYAAQVPPGSGLVQLIL